jgi:hypothetical protein
MKNTVLAFMAAASVCAGQVAVPEGTKVRIRLEQTVSSATFESGSTLEFAVTQSVEIGGAVVIAEGARGTGTVIEALERRRMGRAGKLDFSIDRVMAIDGKWIPLRYTVKKVNGQGKGITTGIMTAGIAAAFWPAAPLALLMKGKDVRIPKGTIFDVFTDSNVIVSGYAPGGAQASARALYPVGNAGAIYQGIQAVPASYQPSQVMPEQRSLQATAPANAGSASVTINSTAQAAEIEVDGEFAGNAPSTLKLSEGRHEIRVTAGSRSWSRAIRISAGSSITLDAIPTEEVQRAARQTTQVSVRK